MSDLSLEYWILPVLLVVSASCSGAQYAEKADEVADVPDVYSSVDVTEAPSLDRWCSDFGSDELEVLVDRAFDESFDLRQAWARLEQAEAIRRRTNASLFPTVDASATAGMENEPASDGATGEFRAELAASYEVDLWGRLAAQRSAAAYDAESERADVEAMAISVTSRVAEAWFDAVAEREKVDLLEEQIDIAENFLDLTVARLSSGVATALDVNQQQQQVERLRGELEQVRLQRALAQNRLAVLLGKSPADGPQVATEELPELPPLPSAGIPADLLERRPDVRSAMLRLQSADAQTAAAARDKLPSLTLSASLFLQAPNLGDLLDEVFWRIAGTLSQTVFSGGRKNAEQERAEAVAKERLYAYAGTVVGAIAEVENAFVAESSQEQFLQHLESQVENAQVALELARQRYRSGAIDYLRVLTALQSLQEVEQTLVDARRGQLSNRVRLCRALGGAWTRDLVAPPPEREESEESS